jgi:hypothetical protein
MTGSDVCLIPPSGTELRVKPARIDEVEIGTESYFPKFGVEVDRAVVTLRTSNQAFGYFIVDDGVDAELDCEHSLPTAALVNGQRKRLPRIVL